MLWFIKRHIFSFIKMKKVLLALSDWKGPDPHLPQMIDGKPLKCLIVEHLDATLDDLLSKSLLCMDSKPYFTLSDAHTRLHDGQIFSIAILDGKIVGWTWSATHAIYFDDFNAPIDLSPKEALSYNTFVHKEYRGRQINQHLLNSVLIHLKSKGIRQIWALIYPWNAASINSYLGNGWTLGKDFYFIKLLGFNFRFLKE